VFSGTVSGTDVKETATSVVAWLERVTGMAQSQPSPAPPVPVPVDTAPTTTASRRPASATGVIAITSTPPGAEVTLDGQARGQSPVELKDVPVGTHTVVLQSAGGRATRQVTVRPGGRTPIEVTFDPGFLVIVSRIPLDIFLGSRRIGSSEDEKIALPAGGHKLTFLNTRLGFRSELVIEIKPNEVTAYTINPPTGGLVVKTVPGAEVLIDGESVGVAPLGELELRVGVHDIKRDQSQDITLPLGSAPLEPPKAAPQRPAAVEPPKRAQPRLAPLSAPPAPRPR
jgi:hypothetical protein